MEEYIRISETNGEVDVVVDVACAESLYNFLRQEFVVSRLEDAISVETYYAVVKGRVVRKFEVSDRAFHVEAPLEKVEATMHKWKP